MLKKEQIKNGQLVFSTEHNTYHVIDNVGDAREKGDRDESSTPDDELSYDIISIVTGKIFDGICKNSGKTTELRTATVEDVVIYLESIEAKANLKLAKAYNKYIKIQQAIHNFMNSKNI